MVKIDTTSNNKCLSQLIYLEVNIKFTSSKTKLINCLKKLNNILFSPYRPLRLPYRPRPTFVSILTTFHVVFC